MKIPRFRVVVFWAIAAMVAIGLVVYPLVHSSFASAKATLTIVEQMAVPVHCHASLADAVAAGKYREANQYVGEDGFPSYHLACKESEERMYLVRFDKGMHRDEAIKRLDMAGFRPADLYELLALGELHAASYRDSTVVALGSETKDMGLCPYLYSTKGERNVGLHGDGECDVMGCNDFLSSGYTWHAGDLFLAVRK